MNLTDMSVGNVSTFMLAYACLGFLGVLLAGDIRPAWIRRRGWFRGTTLLARQGFVTGVVWTKPSCPSRRRTTLFVRWTSALPTSVETNVRSEIAAALHDDVLQCLYNVTIRTQTIKEDLRWGRLLDLDDDVPALLKASEDAARTSRCHWRSSAIDDWRCWPCRHIGLLVEHLSSRIRNPLRGVSRCDRESRAKYRARGLSGGTRSVEQHSEALGSANCLDFPGSG